MAIQVQSIEQQLEKRIFHLETLQRIGREIYSLRAIRPILKTSSNMMCDVLGISNVIVCLVRRRRRVPNIVHQKGFEDQDALEKAITGLPLATWENRDGRRVHILKEEDPAEQRLLEYGVRIWLPLRIDRELFAGIGLGEMLLGVVPSDDLPFLAMLCEQTEVALRNAHLYQHLQRVNTKRREELERSEALHRINLLATTVYDPPRLVEEMLSVLLDWVGESSGKLTLPLDPDGDIISAQLAMPEDEGTLDKVVKIEEEITRRGGVSLTEIALSEEEAGSIHVLCQAFGSRKRTRKTGIFLVVGDKAARRVYKNRLNSLQSLIEQVMIAIEHNRLEAENLELEAANQEIQESNRLKSRFLANMSHELRTPLNAVIAMSDILLEQYFGPLNEKQTEYLKDVHESGQHLLALINDILDLSKVEAGHSPLEPEEVDVKSLLESSLTIVRERASNHGIVLSCEASEDLPIIMADERKVKQVVFNLLSNAVKFTPDGGKVGVRAVSQAYEVEICVWDTGIGIGAEDQDKIFGEFEQSESTLTRQYEGTGLGLALVKRFVEQHGGRIWVESAEDAGSSFYFTLPLNPVTVPAEDELEGGAP